MKKRILAGIVSLCMVVSLIPAPVFADEAVEGSQQEKTVVECLGAETPENTECTADTHNEGCKKYSAPKVCTEGCTLKAGHDGECVMPEKCTETECILGYNHDGEHKAKEDKGATVADTTSVADVTDVAGLIAAVGNESINIINLTGESNQFDIGSTTLVVNRPLTINGNDKKIIGNAISTFEVFADATFNNIKIENTATPIPLPAGGSKTGRCIDTRTDGIRVSINNSELTATGGGNAQPLNISGDDTSGLVVDVDNTKIDAGDSGYAITPWVPATVNIKNNSSIKGYAALYIRDGSSGVTFNVKDSELIGINEHPIGTNNFCTIAFDNKAFVNIEGGTVKAITTNTAAHSIFDGSINTGSIITLNDTEVVCEGDNAFVCFDGDNNYKIKASGKSINAFAAKIGEYYYPTLETAIAVANTMQVGTTVTMLKDWKYPTNGTGLLNITKSIILDGNGHEITGYGSRSGNNTTLAIMAINNGGNQPPVTVTLKNLTIRNGDSTGRPVETRGNIAELNIDNCKFYATGDGNTQVLTIGGNQSTKAKVKINNSTLSAGKSGYPIIMFNPVDMQIESSSFEGYCSLYFKGVSGSAGSHGSVVKANNTTFDAPNIHDSNGGYNNFGVFTLEDDYISITLNSCKVNCKSESTAEQGLVLAHSGSARKSEGYNVTLKGNTEVKGKLLYDNGWNNENCHLNIESGSYTLQAWKIGSNDKAFNITGGTFNIEPKDIYLADGYEYKADGSNYVVGEHNLISVAGTAATCVSTGTKAHYKCEFCGKLYSDAAGNTVVTAESLVIAATGNHTYGDWTTVTAPTCVAKGTEKHVCSVCNAEETREIAATGVHTFGEWKVVKAATCGADGTEERVCTQCSTEKETRAIAATGNHSYGGWERVTNPNCTSKGQDKAVCGVCGHTKYASVAATGHSYGADGKCTVCGNFDATKVTATPAPTATPTPTATPAPTTTPEPTTTPAPVENTKPETADTTVVEVQATEEVVEAVKEAVTVAEGKADIELNTAEKVIELTETGKELVFPLTETTEEVVNKAEVASDALETLAKEETDVVIQLTDATVKLDKEAIAAVKEQAGDRNIEIRAVKAETATLTETQQSAIADKDTAIVVTAQIFADGEYIGDFKGGKATIMLPFTPEEGKAAEDYKVYFIAEDGTLEQVAAEYVDGHMVFTTGHFSEYAIIYEKAEVVGGNDVVTTPGAETQSGASLPIIPIVIVIAIIVIGGIVLMMRKKKED